MKIEKFDGVPLIRLLVYGDSGSGKTTLIGSAMECEETSPLLVLNAGGQPISLRNYKPRPLVLTIETMKDFNYIYKWLKDGQPNPLDPSKHKRPEMTVITKYLKHVNAEAFKSVAVDSITYIQRIALNELIGGAVTAPGDIPPQSQIQHWGRVLAQMTNLADLFYKKLPIHVIISALTRRDTIESMGLTLFAPFLWGQSSMEVPSHAEIVGRLMCTASISTKDQKAVAQAAQGVGKPTPYNILYLKGGRDYIAKWQGVDNPPAMMPSPTMGKLIQVLKR